MHVNSHVCVDALGPSRSGDYRTVTVASIHYKRRLVKTVYAGQPASISFKGGTGAPISLTLVCHELATGSHQDSDSFIMVYEQTNMLRKIEISSLPRLYFMQRRHRCAHLSVTFLKICV